MRLLSAPSLLVATLVIVGLVGCQKKDEKVAEGINLAVADNVAASSMLDWEKSPHHPEKLFALWNEQMIRGELKAEEVCKSLTSTSVEDLVLFENEIRSEQNAAMLKDCKAKLIETLEAYWKKMTPKAEVLKADTAYGASARNDFKFPDNQQTRNLEAGYFAYTGDVQSKEVILTFDDGPHPEYTKPILATLREVNAKAIFFEVGKNVRLYPDLVKAVASDNHSIGGHSMYHLCLPLSERCRGNNNGKALSVAEAIADMRGSMQAIYNVLGWVDPYFRFPYGESSLELKAYLKNAHVGEFYWSVDSNDWRSKDSKGEAWTPERMVDSVMSQLNNSRKKNGIVLMHDVQKKTMIALPELLRRLYNDGYTPVLLVPERDEERSEPAMLRSAIRQ